MFHIFQAVTKFAVGQFLDVFVGIIDIHRHIHQNVGEIRPDVPDPFGKAAFQLVQGHLEGLVGPGPYQVHYGLCLAQVKPAVQEGSLGEFTGFRQPGSLRDDQGENLP